MGTLKRLALVVALILLVLGSISSSDARSDESGAKSSSEVGLVGWAHRAETVGSDAVDRLRKKGALSRPTLSGSELTYNTTHFQIHYTLSGEDAVDPADSDFNGVPDYIEMMGSELENVWTTEITVMGWLQPPSDLSSDGNSDYDVYVENLPDGIYGYTQSEYLADQGASTGDNENSPGVVEDNSAYSYIGLDNDYSEFVGSAIDNIRVAAAHEFNHAIQFGYDVFEEDWLSEATAAWMEDEVYDYVNGNLQYVPGYFNNPDVAMASETPERPWYADWIFLRYISEHYGGQSTVRRIWESSVSYDSYYGDYAFDAIQDALSFGGYDLATVFNNFTVANYVLSTYPTNSPYCYEEALAYPRVYVEGRIDYTGSPVAYYPQDGVGNFGADYIEVRTDPAPDVLRITVSGASPAVTYAARIVGMQGGVASAIDIPMSGSPAAGWVDISPADYDRVILIVENVTLDSSSLNLFGYNVQVAQPPRQTPSRFYGTVQIDGAGVPDGTVITAKVEGDEYATTTPSAYGLSTYALTIAPPAGTYYAEGTPITFMIGDRAADQTANWVTGGNTELDLSAGEVPGQLPSSFYGTGQADGAGVPDGTVITAEVEGDEYATTTPSAYGLSTYALTVAPPAGTYYAEGTPITFMIGDRAAAQTANWVTGSNTELNLSAGEAPRQLPSRFYGTLQVNGADVPVGTLIRAIVGGDTYVTITPSVYGLSTYALTIAPPAGTYYAEGTPITFMIGGRAVAQTANWVTDGNTELNLSAGEAPRQPLSRFYGTLQVDGADVPVGTLIRAIVGGDTYVTITPSVYGLSTYALTIAPPAGTYYADGVPIIFMIGNRSAGQTANWIAGGNTALALSAGEAPTFDSWTYDTDKDGVLSKEETLAAIVDYFDGLITKEQALAVLILYFS